MNATCFKIVKCFINYFNKTKSFQIFGVPHARNFLFSRKSGWRTVGGYLCCCSSISTRETLTAALTVTVLPSMLSKVAKSGRCACTCAKTKEY